MPLRTIRLLYRDVKPRNILLAEDGRAKVSDMGLSRAEFFSSSHAFAGTFMYAAPEVLLGLPSNEKVRTRHLIMRTSVQRMSRFLA
jgi:serine/threonine protein kinase